MDFDFIEVQNSIRGSHSVRDLYGLFDWISKLYETNKIGEYEYEETSYAIKARMAILKNQAK